MPYYSSPAASWTGIHYICFSSSVGPSFARKRGQLFVATSIIFFLIGIGVTLGTYETAASHSGYFILYAGKVLSFLLNFLILDNCIFYIDNSLSINRIVDSFCGGGADIIIVRGSNMRIEASVALAVFDHPA